MQDLLPVSILIPQFIQFTENTVALRALFDTGGTVTLVHAQALTNSVIPTQSNTQTFTTIAGQFESKQHVLFQNIVLPEFKQTAKIDSHSCQVFHGPCAYDIIIGHDLMRKIHFKINFDNNTIEYMDITIPMHPSNFFDETIRLHDVLSFENDDFDVYATAITISNYKATSIIDIVQKQLHLSLQNPNQLFLVLSRHSRLFNSVLKVFPCRLIHLDLLPNAIPTHQHAYSVAHVHLEDFKNELS